MRARLVGDLLLDERRPHVAGADRARADSYRSQLQRQQLDLDRTDALGRLDPVERRSRLETQTELNRMNDLLRAPEPLPLRLPATRALPSLSAPTVPRSP